MVDAAAGSSDPVTDAVKSIRETAKWAVAALAGVGTAIAAGSQLSSIGALDIGVRWGIAMVAAVVGLLAVGAGIWLTIDFLVPTQAGLAELADPNNKDTFAVREYLNSHTEFFQGQANTLAELKQKLDDGLKDRDAKYATAQANPAIPSDVAAANQANRDYGYLLTIVNTLIGFAILQEVRLQFRRWRLLMVVVVLTAAIAMLAFAWAANPAKPEAATASAVGLGLTGLHVRINK